MAWIKKHKIITAIILVVIVGGSYYYYKKSQSSSGETQYVTEAAEKGTLTTSISASGNIVVDQSANIDPDISGTVENIAVQVGDQVKKGQLLFTITNDQLEVTLQQARASYTQAQSSLTSAQAAVNSAKASLKSDKKSKTTHEQKLADEQKIDSAKTAEDAAEQSLTAARLSLNYALDQADKRSVTSPISGTVNEVNVENGDDLSNLSSGSARTVPIIIGDLETIKAEVQVNEVDIANVSVGQKVTMSLDALGSDFETTGKVEKIDSLGASSSGVVTYNVTIEFDSLDSRIKPEMSVTASIITDVKQDVLIIPSSAVKTSGDGSYYVQVLENGSPVHQTVKVGASNDTSTEITSGLNAGDNVVTQTITSSSSSSSASSSSKSSSGSSSLRIPGLSGGGGPRD
ncbi:MAG: efflux RND transporter periplasmic adaptor subunit [Candidatus Moranbacteria bacterium]|nr:efflux RND transporter periplasmic adaptor subunit [Candidatus Moranbacteria bacterium]